MNRCCELLLLTLVICTLAHTQATPVASKKATEQANVAPATKMEAFQPAAGTVVTFGYDDLGRVAGITADVREVRDSKGASVRGLLVNVSQSEYLNESSFVDADELTELIKGLDALMQVTTNPTQFKNFEVKYKTRGGLELTTYNNAEDKIEYAVAAGRFSRAKALGLNAAQMLILRGVFTGAQTKLTTVTSTH